MSISFFGEMLLRLSPSFDDRLQETKQLSMFWGGAELNTAILLKRLGEDVNYVSFLPDNDIGENARRFLLSNRISDENVFPSSGRCGIYFYEMGFGDRSGKVVYDRQNSSFALSTIDKEQWKTILKDTSHFHYTGITAAVSLSSLSSLLTALEVCKENNITVSCDVNYRKALWTINEAKTAFLELFKYTDICIINEEQAKTLFDITSSSKGDDNELNEHGYEEIAKQLYNTFSFKYVALTMRRTISAKTNILFGSIYDGEKSYFSNKYTVYDIVDRIGGGDAFSSGIIYCLKNNYDLQHTIDFATSANAIKHSIKGDCALVSKEEILGVMTGKGKILNR